MKSRFLESELELYVQRLLVHEFYSTGNLYRMLKISPSEERLKGYDAKIVGLTPFYCQFKTSDFVSQGGLFKRRSAFSKTKGWPSSPFYSFPLRVPNDRSDKKKPEVWQHNILHSSWKANPSGVAYVAPAFHTRTEMDLHEPFHGYWGCPYHEIRFPRSNISIREVIVDGHVRCRLPFFDGLVSIPPHLPVKDLKHSYAFTNHRDVTFHSNPELVEGSRQFGEALELFIKSSIEREAKSTQKKLDVNSVVEMLGELGNDREFLAAFLAFGLFQAGMSAQQIGGDVFETFSNVVWLQQHIALAASLHSYFGISTLGLLKVEKQ